jgi:predicted enzyme related to lactoylglutathione lyase
MHIVFSVPDPQAAYATLKSRGADVSVRGNPPSSPITAFLVHDSEGNEIEVVADEQQPAPAPAPATAGPAPAQNP